MTAILLGNLQSAPEATSSVPDELCQCAAAILSTYGMDFYTWMDTKLKAGNTVDDPPDFTPAPITLCPDFTFASDTAAQIEHLLADRYAAYRQVSYRLWIVVSLLSQLRSTYPAATLHDCDVGSDQNPVRLGKTALGI